MAYEKKTYSKPYKKKEATAKAQYKPKRGKLAPLMKEEEKSKAGIHDEESGGQELSYTHYTPINTIYSLRNCYLSVA